MRNAQLIELLMEIKIPQFYGVLHEVNQYVDDSTNLIGSNTKEEMEKYLESYHKVIETYYSANKLKINSDKTQLIITRKKWKDKTDEKVKFKTKEGDTIREVNALRVLGFIKNNRDSYDSHLGQVNGRVVKTLAELKPYTKHMDQNTRKEIIYSKVASIALYGCELFTGQTEWTTSKFTSILMKCNREIFQRDWFKVSNSRICKEIKVDHPIEIIKKSTLKFMHKLIWTKSPDQLYDKLKFNTKHRECSNISVKCPVSKLANRRTPIYTGLELYNSMSIRLKLTRPKRFKFLLKKMKL